MDNIDEINIFSRLAESLISNKLDDEQDKLNAQLWLKKIKNETFEEFKINYLKLMIFSMQKRKLEGIFAHPPNENKKLDENPEGISTLASNHRLTESKVSEPHYQKDSDTESSHEIGPIFSSVGGDLKEYAAKQTVNDHFMQGYYAFSTDEPIVGKIWDVTNVDPLIDDEKDEVHSIEAFMRQTENYQLPLEQRNTVSCECNDAAVQKIPEDLENSRPSWGRNRYVQRLIDQSPYSVGDLENVEADAILASLRNG